MKFCPKNCMCPLHGGPMHEKRYCLDCGSFGPMNVHGLCSVCGSSAVVLGESVYQFQRQFNESVDECERIFSLQERQ